MEFRIGLYFLALITPQICWGTILLSVPEALDKVCSKNKIEKKNEYLLAEEIHQINADLEYKIDEKSASLIYYECLSGDKIVGTAYIDTDQVRKETESLLIVVDSEEHIRDIEVLSFNEPKEYMPPEVWKKQFNNKGFLELNNSKMSTVGITGATLTSKSVAKSVEKILAIHRFIEKKKHAKKS